MINLKNGTYMQIGYFGENSEDLENIIKSIRFSREIN